MWAGSGKRTVRRCRPRWKRPRRHSAVLKWSFMAPDVPMTQTFKGVLPFVLSDVVRVGIILLVPATTLYLPGML